MTVSGNAFFATNSIFGVNANGDGQASKLAVGGTAALTGGSVKVTAGGAFAPSTQYTILTAAGGLGGAISAAFLAISPFSHPRSAMTPDVKLTLACNNPGACDSGTGGGGGGGTGGGGTGTGGGAWHRWGRHALRICHGCADTEPDCRGNSARWRSDVEPTVTAALNQSVDGARQAFDALSGEVYEAACTMRRPKKRNLRAARCSRACGRHLMPVHRVNSARSASPVRNWLTHLPLRLRRLRIR